MAKTPGSEAVGSAPPILESIDEVDAAWMRRALVAAGLPGVPEITRIGARPIGAGTVGDTRRVEIAYRGDGAALPDSVVCKFHPIDPESRAGATQGGALLREAKAYELISATDACRIPRPYFVASDGTRLNLVLEDLSEVAEAGDQIRGCSIREAEAVIDELASLHLRFFPLSAERTAEWMMSMEAMADLWAPGILGGAELASERFAGELSPEKVGQLRACAGVADRWYRRICSCLTFTHGEPRVDNVMFEKTPDGIRAILIDWQLPGIRSAMYDVAYFLTGSLRTEDRRRAEGDLVRRYFGRVEDAGLFADEESALREYQANIVANLMLTILSIASLPNKPEIDHLILTLLRRTLVACEDHGGVGAIEAALSASQGGPSGRRST